MLRVMHLSAILPPIFNISIHLHNFFLSRFHMSLRITLQVFLGCIVVAVSDGFSMGCHTFLLAWLLENHHHFAQVVAAFRRQKQELLIFLRVWDGMGGHDLRRGTGRLRNSLRTIETLFLMAGRVLSQLVAFCGILRTIRNGGCQRLFAVLLHIDYSQMKT